MYNPFPDKEIFIKHSNGCIMYKDGSVYIAKGLINIKEEIFEEDNIKPFYPLPFRNGNSAISQWEEPFVCNAGNKGVATYVKYRNSKGNVIDRHFLRVKWDE